MIREVYINDQLIDIEADNTAGYIFSSPIFRDISKIMSNRTTTYKIPKTTKNLSIFGLANNPDVNALAPYRKHKFLEIRDGLPFINGVCYFLKSTEKELELAVFWGNSEKLQELKDLNLRELDIKDEFVDGNRPIEYFRWDNSRECLPNPSSDDAGFLKIDYGKGLEDMKYIHPAVNIKYILDVIKCSTGITITYEDRFIEEFKKKWFPLTSKNTNEITYNDEGRYYVNSLVVRQAEGSFRLKLTNIDGKIITQEGKGTAIIAPPNSIVGITNTVLRFKTKIKYSREIAKEASIRLITNGFFNRRQFAERTVEVIKEETKNGFSYYVFEFDLGTEPLEAEIPTGENNEYLDVLVAIRQEKSTKWEVIDQFELDSLSSAKVYVKPKELQFGDKYPLIPNLPNLSVIDFLKSLMSMYGLFTYQDIKSNPDVIEFTSIDAMYSKKDKTIDWTDKLLMFNNDTRMKVEYTYGDYARKNYLKYKNDKDITINADGYITVDNEQLEKEKDLIELPYSPSITIRDENNNQYALVPIYDSEGNYSDVGIRILDSVEYVQISTDDPTEKIYYKSAYFNNTLYFSGEEGLLKKYYSKYQSVIYHPIVVECAVYLTDLELHQFREVNPIYIDGVYYMPITVTVQTNGVANCKLIKMPFIEK